MKRLFVFLFSLLLGVFLFAITVRQIGWRAILSSVAELPLPVLLLLVAVTFLMLLLGTLRWREVLRSQGTKATLLPLFLDYVSGFALSFLTPMAVFGGEAFRAYAASERTNTQFSKVFALVVAERVLEVVTYAVVVIAGIAIFFFESGTPPAFLFWILGAALVVLGFVGILFFKEKSILKNIFQLKGRNGAVEAEREVLRFFRFENRFLWTSLMFSVAKSSLAVARTWLLLSFLKESSGALQAFLVTSFYYASLFVPIPASLGLHEILQTFAFGAIGSSATTGVAFALIIRTAELMVAATGLVLLAHFGFLVLLTKAARLMARMVKSEN